MYGFARIRNVLLISSLSAIVLTCTGCPGILQPSPLVGTWQLQIPNNQNPALQDVRITFDSQGDLTEVRFTVNGVTVVRNVPDVRNSVSLNGQQLSIDIEYSNGGSLSFNGVLNGQGTAAVGNLQYSLTINNTTLISQTVPATLVLDP